MFKRLIIIVSLFSLLIMPALGATMTGTGYQVEPMDGLGGGGSKSGGGYVLQDLIGAPVVGDSTDGSTVSLEAGGLSALATTPAEGVIPPPSEEGVPEGTVPLTISRSGSGIVLTWEASVYSSIDIYFLTGTGNGEFSNDTGWGVLQAAAPGGTYTDANQVGAGDNEKYYKALVAGQDPAADHAEGGTYISQAWAVGKVNVEITGSPNLVSMPFKLSNTTIDGVFGGQINQEEALFASYDNTSKSYSIYEYSGGSWVLQTGSEFEVVSGKPYWLLDSATGTITLIGAVSAEAYSTELSNGPNLFSLPTPLARATVEEANLDPVEGDLVARYNNATKAYEIMEVTGGAWTNSIAGEPVFGLNPGWGYWYINGQEAAVVFSLNIP